MLPLSSNSLKLGACHRATNQSQMFVAPISERHMLNSGAHEGGGWSIREG